MRCREDGSQPSPPALASRRFWHGCVEKCGDHRGQPLGAVRERHMRCAGEHGQLGTRQTDEVTYYAAAEQAKHLDHVFRAHDIGVPNDEQGRRFDRGNGLARPAESRAVEIHYFRNQPVPILRVRCDAGVFLLERGAIQVFGFHGLGGLQEFGVQAVASITGPSSPDEFAHQGGRAQSNLQGDSAPRAIAEEIGLLDLEMTQESSGVLRQLLETERAINVGCAPMSLLLNSDNPPRRGKLRQPLAERGADGREIAVQQHQRPAAAVYLVVHLQTIHGSIATLDGRARMILRGHISSYPFCYSFAFPLLPAHPLDFLTGRAWVSRGTRPLDYRRLPNSQQSKKTFLYQHLANPGTRRLPHLDKTAPRPVLRLKHMLVASWINFHLPVKDLG